MRSGRKRLSSGCTRQRVDLSGFMGWLRYRIELYPHIPGMGIGCGILDRYGNELEFPSAFRQSRRDGKSRGIVKIKYGGQP